VERIWHLDVDIYAESKGINVKSKFREFRLSYLDEREIKV